MKVLERIVEELPVPLFVVGENLKLIYFNEEFEQFFKVDKTFIGQALRDVIGCAMKLEDGETEESCIGCELKKAILSSESQIVFNKFIEKELKVQGETTRYNIKLSVKKVFIDDVKQYICLINNIIEVDDEVVSDRLNTKKLFRDMTHASAIQHDLLPKKGKVEFVDLDYIYDQSYPIGGDFFGVYKINKNLVGAFIADVSGHGMSSGMLTVFLNQVFPYHLASPEQILVNLNKRYDSCKFSGSEYITVMPLIINDETKTIKFSNAGHMTPIYIIREGRLIEYSISGTPVSGWFVKYNYEEVTIEYKKGDKVVLFTDGATDLKNINNEEFGIERFKETLLSTDGDIHDVCQAVQTRLNDYSKKVKVKLDDIAVLILQL